MLTVASQGHAHRIDGLDRAHGIALDARYLHQSANRVAGQAEVVFHADFGGVFHLLHRAAQHFTQGAGGHGTGDANLTLTADFGAGDRGVFLVQNADRGGRQQKAYDAVFVGTGDETHVVMQHRRDDSGCTIGGRGDHASAVGVFFVDRQGVQVDPVQHRQRIAQ